MARHAMVSAMSKESVMRVLIALPFAVAVLAVVLVASAQEGGDPKAGAAIAEAQCAECHVVREGQTPSFHSFAPTFASIASRPGMTVLALRVTLRTPHRTMPNIVLTDRQIDDLAAYVLTLKR